MWTTYKSIAKLVGLNHATTQRYIKYMMARWQADEELNCKCGYAEEWAVRFKEGFEYSCSDHIGQEILRKIDKE